MPDLTPLPSLPVSPTFRPDVGRFDAVARTARRRRAARTVPVGLALVGVVALGSVTGPAGTNGLEPLDRATAVTSEPPARAAGADGDAGAPSAPGAPAAGVTVTPLPTPDPTVPPLPTPPPLPLPSETSSRPAPPPATECPSPWVTQSPGDPDDDLSCSYTPEVTYAALDSAPFDASAGCETYHVDGSEGWCLRSRNTRTVASGGTLRVVLEVCRPSAAGTLSFADETEVKVGSSLPKKDDGTGSELGEGISLAWSSRLGAGAHSIDVAGGTCARWSADVPAYDTLGNPMAPGEYSVVWIPTVRVTQRGVGMYAEWPLRVT